jgi:hypothetical protein
MDKSVTNSDGTNMGDADRLGRVLGPPTSVSDEQLAAFKSDGEFSSLAFELYKETASLVVLASGLLSSPTGVQDGMPRDQAICVGLLVRIIKFMTAVMQLVSGDSRRREVVMSLTRSILESAVNVRYLLAKNDPDVFRSFVVSGLGPERELYDVIERNIKDRGGAVQPIEKRMLWSIERTCRLGGVTITDIPLKSSWVNLRERFNALGDEDLYLSVQRIGSHAVHGTWSDLILHHLDEAGNGLVADPEWALVDTRILCPPCYLVIEAVKAYLTHYFAGFRDLVVVEHRILDLLDRVRKVDHAHERWMSNRDVETRGLDA